MAATMASYSGAAMQVLLLLLVVLQTAPAVADDGTTHLHFFMHDILTGSNPTAVQVIKGPGPAAVPGLSFGDTTVIDDALTETSSANSAAVGRGQGLYMLSSQSGTVFMVCMNLLLTAGDYNGSTVAVLGRDDTAQDVRELPVVGGTGKFRMATGYVLWKTTSMNGPDATIELDVYLTTADNGTATIDPNTPVSPVAGGSSSSAAATARWVNSCVLVAVVGLLFTGVRY